MKNLIFFFLSIQLSFGQIKFSTNDNTPPDASAQLEVKSSNKGLLLPRLNPTNINTPAQGLMVFNNNSQKVNVNTANGWAALGGGGLYDKFPNSIGYRGTIASGATMYSEYTFVVPSGINKIWIEAWAGGDSGNIIIEGGTASSSSPGFAGGDAGDYASFLMDVTPAENLTLRVGRGGSGSGSATSATPGGSTVILTTIPPIRTYTISQQSSSVIYTEANISQNFCPGLIQFVAGGDGQRSTISYQQSGATEFRRVSTGGNGGDAYPGQKGGTGLTISFSMVDNIEMMGTLITATGGNGSSPGGGGGLGFGQAGSGGPGMIIVHW